MTGSEEKNNQEVIIDQKKNKDDTISLELALKDEWVSNYIKQEVTKWIEKYKWTSWTLKEFAEQKTIVNYYALQQALPKWMNEWQTLMAIQAWKEMWLSFIQAINWLYFVNWRLCIYWEVMVSQVVKNWYKLNFIESTSSICKVEMTAPDWNSITEEFTYEEATKAGRTWKWVWKTQPKIMLRYKAIRQAIKFLAPHLLGWTITVEEAQVELPKQTQQEKAKKMTNDELYDKISDCNTIKELETLKPEISKNWTTDTVQAYAVKLKQLEDGDIEDAEIEAENG